MKYLKNYKNVGFIKYIYDRQYIEECLVDIEWKLIEANLDYFEICISKNDIKPLEYAAEKVKIKYPNVIFNFQVENELIFAWFNFAI